MQIIIAWSLSTFPACPAPTDISVMFCTGGFQWLSQAATMGCACKWNPPGVGGTLAGGTGGGHACHCPGLSPIDRPPGGVAGPSCDPVTLGPRWAEPLGRNTGKWTRPGQTGPVARVRVCAEVSGWAGPERGRTRPGPVCRAQAVQAGLPCSVQAPSSKTPDRLGGERGRIHWDRWGSGAKCARPWISWSSLCRPLRARGETKAPAPGGQGTRAALPDPAGQRPWPPGQQRFAVAGPGEGGPVRPVTFMTIAPALSSPALRCNHPPTGLCLGRVWEGPGRRPLE